MIFFTSNRRKKLGEVFILYGLIAQSGHATYGIKEYICDTITDIDSLPIDDKAGSTAYVIEDGNTYILSHSHEWKKKKTFTNGSSEELETKVEELEKQIFTLTTANESLVTQVQELTESNIILTNEKVNLESQKAELTNSVNTLTQENNELSDQVNSLIAEKADLLEQVKELQDELSSLTAWNPIEGKTTLQVPVTKTAVVGNTLFVSEDTTEINGTTLILK